MTLGDVDDERYAEDHHLDEEEQMELEEKQRQEMLSEFRGEVITEEDILSEFIKDLV